VGLKKGRALVERLSLPLNLPSFEPGHVTGGLEHVVAMPSGNGNEIGLCVVVTNLLDEVRNLLLDFLESGLL